MNQKSPRYPRPLHTQTSTTVQLSPVDVLETSATKGEWTVPAIEEVSLALALSDFSARWRGSRGLRSEAVSTGTLAICEYNQSKRFEMRSAAKFAIVLLRNEVLQQVGLGTGYIRPELQAHEVVQDQTLRHLMEVLLREKREGFLSGSLFLDGVSTALASYLLRRYSVASRTERNVAGGMAPTTLRRCVEFMEAHLDGNLRLSELALEAGVSTSHFLRSFRQSTGKTPYQFLLHRRVERARILMRDLRAPLAQVAQASGFADQHHLSRVFRRITGVTPSSYRHSL
jgi:AraC family transcriptional regulator